jgi:3-phenylpropionate/cinnamic acid dioxygenase small subunit
MQAQAKIAVRETEPTSTRRIRSNEPLFGEVQDWLFDEADLLDTVRDREWLDTMLSKDIVYRMPVREVVGRGEGAGFIKGLYHLNETYGSINTKVARNETGFAWAEDPATRTRHFVSNIRVFERENGTLEVKSSLLLLQTRRSDTEPNIMAAERHDLLRREGETLRLFKRDVYVDLTALEAHNLAIYF